MERRMLLAVVLSIIAVTGYSAVTGRGCVPPPPPKDQTEDGAPAKDGDTDAPDEDGKQAKAGRGDGKGPPPGDGSEDPDGDADGPDAPAPAGDGGEETAPHPQAEAPRLRAKLESAELVVTFTSQGGAIESVQLKNVFEADHVTAFDQILPVDPTMLMGQTDDTGLVPPAAPGDANRENLPPGPMRRPSLQWTRDTQAEEATPEDDVIFTFETREGLVHRKQWFLVDDQDRYDVVLRISVAAAAGAGQVPDATDVKLLAISGHIRERATGAFLLPNALQYRLSDSADVSDRYEFGLPIVELQTKGLNVARLRMLASKSSYFLTSYYGSGAQDEPTITHFWATGEQADLRGDMEEHLVAFYAEHRDVDLAAEKHADLRKRIVEGIKQLHHVWMALRLEVGAERPSELKFYVGPHARGTLAQDAYDPIEPVVTYPNAPDFVADILMWIYDVWLGLLGSAGLAVILMTLCVRGAMMPLSVRNQLSMRKYGRKVSKLKPKVKALQQQYANNPKKLREKQMALYREHGVGFPTGCLMMLIQIPVFFALFSALRVEYTIRGATFLWIDDLSGPDRLIDFGQTVLNLGFFWIESINILPLVMVGLSIFHMRNMPKPADEQQAQQMKMMKWLPIVFAVILYNYTAALAIYMVMSSAFAIIESKIVRARDEEEEAGEGAAAAKA